VRSWPAPPRRHSSGRTPRNDPAHRRHGRVGGAGRHGTRRHRMVTSGLAGRRRCPVFGPGAGGRVVGTAARCLGYRGEGQLRNRQSALRGIHLARRQSADARAWSSSRRSPSGRGCMSSNPSNSTGPTSRRSPRRRSMSSERRASNQPIVCLLLPARRSARPEMRGCGHARTVCQIF
jgi:hypothetical protein